jgi:hypothetical protein
MKRAPGVARGSVFTGGYICLELTVPVPLIGPDRILRAGSYPASLGS